MHQHTNSRWILLAALLTLPCLLGNKGCEEKVETADGGAPQGRACTSKECGPAPGAPNVMCSDGSLGGPGPCGRLSNGECGYAWHECPPADDAGTGDRDASALACGTRGGAVCRDGDFCNFEPDADCGGTDRGGACEPVPTACTDLYQPVCGCDNRTYSNACDAHSGSVSVKHDGTCEGTTGKTCGGIASLSCATGEFCNYEVSAGGQGCEGRVADSGGVCQTLPNACTKEHKPVCGCDHKSYGNACTAHSAGVAVLHEGACTEIDCKAIGGHPVDGIGPSPQCPKGEVHFTDLVYSNGNIPIEGTACCVPTKNQ